jgi:DNA-binding winged helix-turn-helix (wHTH) protein/TolB-like protein
MQTKLFYDFGLYRIDLTQRILLLRDKHVPLQPKTFETLLALVEHPGEIVEKDELMRRIWPDVVVEEVNLAKNISALRKLFHETDPELEIIQTIPKRGYRFAADLREVSEASAEHHTPDSLPEPAESIAPAMPPPSPPPPRRSAGHVWIALAMATTLFLFFYLTPIPGNALQNAEAPRKSVAVLPFRQINAPANGGMLSAGISETLVAQLNAVKNLTVRPLANSDPADRDPIFIGRALQVDLLVAGSVQYAADKARVNVQILDAATGRQLWSQVFDEPAGGNFALQDQVSRHVASALRFEIR